MTMTLRVVVPPHPLIAHWLTVLRGESTPPPIFATGLEEIGRWLTYEALRDWVPHRQEQIKTLNGITEGVVIEASIPLFSVPINQGGFELWHGGRKVLPNSFFIDLETNEKASAMVWPLGTLPFAMAKPIALVTFLICPTGL